MTLDPRVTGHKDYNPEAKEYLENFDTKLALNILNHPRTSKQNLKQVSRCARKNGVFPTLRAWGHQKTTPENLDLVASQVSKYWWYRHILDIWGHEKTTEENFKDVIAASPTPGFRSHLEAWAHPKTTLEDLPIVSRIFFEYGIPKATPAWDHPKTTKDSLKAVVSAINSVGERSALSAWGHEKANAKNLKHMARLCRICGKDNAKELFDEKRISAKDMGNVERSIIAYGFHPTLLAIRHPMGSDAEHRRQIANNLHSQARSLKGKLKPFELHSLQKELISHGHMPTKTLILRLHGAKNFQRGLGSHKRNDVKKK